MIVIKTAETSKEYKDFVNFPFSLYKDSKYWVPPISNEELNTMDKSKNPVFKNAEAEYFLAYKNDKIVGRIAAIVNWIEVKEQNKNHIAKFKENSNGKVCFGHHASGHKDDCVYQEK